MEVSNARAAKCTIVLGFNGTGKTTYLRNTLMALWAQAHNKGERLKILVVTPDDAEWTMFDENPLLQSDDFVFDGIMRHIWNDGHTPDILQYYKNGIIVFDDCRCYFKDNIDRRKDCITNFDYFKRKQAEVNQRSKRDPHYHIRIKNTDI